MSLNVANNGQTTLVETITAAQTSFSVVNASVFPAAPFRVTIDGEILEVGEIDIINNLFSIVTRGVENTTAAIHNAGAFVENRWTAGYYEELRDAVTAAQDAANTHIARMDNPHGVTPAQIGAETPTGAQNKVNTHANLTSAHSATSAATANRIMMRDAAGRAKVAAPSASDDIARKAEVDAVQANLNTTNANLTTTNTNLSNHTNAASPHSGHVKGTMRITVAASAPGSPAVNDLWIEI